MNTTQEIFYCLAFLEAKKLKIYAQGYYEKINHLISPHLLLLSTCIKWFL